MDKQVRKEMQKRREGALKLPEKYIVKGESLFDRARKFGWAVNDTLSGNRETRRSDIKEAIREERKVG
jgi:hypothetical protein